jgi:hypothetical protein
MFNSRLQGEVPEPAGKSNFSVEKMADNSMIRQRACRRSGHKLPIFSRNFNALKFIQSRIFALALTFRERVTGVKNAKRIHRYDIFIL